MKILDITEFYSPVGGGVRIYLTAKARWLAGQTDVDHVIVVPSNTDAIEPLWDSRTYRVKGPSVPLSPGYHFFVGASRVRQIIEDERPDVIEVGSPFLAAWLARRASAELDSQLIGFFHCDARRVYVDHGLRMVPSPLRNWVGSAFEGYLARLYRSFRRTVAATPASALTLRELGVESVNVIPLGVDTEVFRPDVRDPTWRDEVGALPDQPVGLYAGRFSTEKGLAVVLEALPELHRRAGVKLVLIGEGHLRENLERFAREHPSMLATLPYERNRRSLARAYASADFYIAPFPLETFGLAAVEAIASGLPVVGIGTGGIADLLRGVAWGRTYRPGDAADFRRAALELLANDLRALGARARAAAVANYSWDRTFRVLLELYRSVVNGRSPEAPAEPEPAA